MALTHAQLDNAAQSADALSRFRGAILRAAGYIVNGDPAENAQDLKTARRLWARRAILHQDSAQFLVDTAARFARFSAGTSGTFQGATEADLSDLLDADFDSMVAVIIGDLAKLQAIENVTVQP